MKKINNWIKHEYRIIKKIDKPTRQDYLFIWKSKIFLLPIFATLTVAVTIIFLKILLFLNIDLNSFVGHMLSFMFMFIFAWMLALPVSYLQYLNSDYDE